MNDFEMHIRSANSDSSISRKRARRGAGFTLVELMIVISILLILMSIAIPVYEQTIVRAKETVLRQDLFTMRKAIDQYTEDKQKAPQSLQDLVSAGYIKKLPEDPFTKSTDTWQAEQGEDFSSIDQQGEPGIVDVHSGSSLTSTEGSAYSSW